ncbi:MAG: hypothetical protein JKX81_13720 [Arenicella sp.]|nr:hypothetical protein [Arenicella sp.]
MNTYADQRQRFMLENILDVIALRLITASLNKTISVNARAWGLLGLLLGRYPYMSSLVVLISPA